MLALLLGDAFEAETAMIVGGRLGYLPFALLTWAAAGLRLSALRARRRSPEPIAQPA
jgi:hypothetical protein